MLIINTDWCLVSTVNFCLTFDADFKIYSTLFTMVFKVKHNLDWMKRMQCTFFIECMKSVKYSVNKKILNFFYKRSKIKNTIFKKTKFDTKKQSSDSTLRLKLTWIKSNRIYIYFCQQTIEVISFLQFWE